MIQNFLSFLDKYGGALFAAAFFGFMCWLFYWLLIVNPRKINRFFKSLEKKGFRSIDPDAPGLAGIIERLVPPHPGRIRDENVTPWNVKNAVQKRDANKTSSILFANRNEAHAGDNGIKKHIITVLLFMEEQTLDMNGRVYVTPKKNPSANRWEKQYNVLPVTDNYDSSLRELYDFYSPDKEPVPLPGGLDKALITICPLLCRRDSFCFQNGVNLLFGPDGWGMCPDNYAYKEPHLNDLVELFETISNSLNRR